jgi:GT2 family glycosyltransferase
MSHPALSIVVCTRNRLGSLKRCVEAFCSVSTAHDWELVIVDNNSEDGTGEYLASIDPTQLGKARLVRAFEGKRGLASARNTGWRAASADIVAFTDDDCYVATDFVDSYFQVFEENPTAGFASGRILLFDVMDYRITIQESQDRCYFQPRVFIAAGAVQGANMAFRRTVLERIGGFDERFGSRFPCEDIDAVASALWAGIPGIYDPRPVVYHHHGRRTQREATELMRRYDAGRGAYYAKYVLMKVSRWKYITAWMSSVRDECIHSLRNCRFPVMGHSCRELFNGLWFVLSEYDMTRFLLIALITVIAERIA